MDLLNKLFIVCVVGLAGCAVDRDVSTRPVLDLEGQGSENGVSYWDGDGVTGHARIKIDLDSQRAYFYKGNKMVGVSVVSTGREGYNTPPGEFRVIQKDVNHASSLYGDYVDHSG